MVKMSEESKQFIKENLPDYLEAETTKEILMALYDLIMYKGFISHEKGYNDFGDEAQVVYDDIFNSNYDD